MNELLLFVILLSGCYLVSSEKVVVCYYGTWATYRIGLGKFTVDDVNTELCSHVIYSFVGIDSVGTMISLDSYLDLDYGHGNFRKFTNLKQQNPNLKTILAVGGWNEGSGKYSIMSANPTYRQNFIKSALAMIQEYNFDGLDLDWEYPNKRDTVYGSADIDNLTQLTKELREEFDKYGLLLTAAVSAVKDSASQSYNIAEISKYLDFIHIMTYDLYGAWDPTTGHNAPLHKGEGDTADREDLYTVDVAVEYWLSEGCPPEKLVLGMPLYGRTFTLSSSTVNGVRAPAVGAGLAGPYTLTSGFMGYNEICDKLQTETWDIKYDSLAKVPYAVQGVNWISYDDPESLIKKVEYANSLNLAGGMVWSIETDDFNNVCGGGDFPLLRAINKALGRHGDDETTEKPGTTQELVTTEETETSTEKTVTTTEKTETTTEKAVTTDKSTEAPTTTKTTASNVVSNTPPEEIATTEKTDLETTGVPADTVICKEEGFTSNPEDCSSFYVCITNNYGELEAKKFECAPTTYWDQSSLSCDYKERVRCDLD